MEADMISVVIPVYNSEKTIENCVDSVLKQTREDLIGEVIIVDDGSKDKSADIVTRLASKDQRIKVIKKKNGGVSTARNAGIRASRYRWIAFIDSDDIWLPEKIEKQWEQIQKHRQICFIGCNRNKEFMHWGKKADDNLYVLGLKHILLKTWPHTSTVMIKRSVFKEVGLFNERMRYAEDGDMWNRIALKYFLFYIPVSYEIAGNNKVPYGESGLSANLKEMHKGNLRNIKMLYKKRNISNLFYLFLICFYDAKYYRRILISKINAVNDSEEDDL